MNWEAIGAIAETLGAIGVIASLVYLAGQIRHSREQMEQNTRATMAATYQRFDEVFHTTMMEALHVPGLDEVVRSGWSNFEQLDEANAFRFNLWINGVMKRIEGANYQYRVGMMELDRWQIFDDDLHAMLRFPGIAQWWRPGQGRSALGPEFVALVNGILAEESERE
jgi:hypothetical protein